MSNLEAMENELRFIENEVKKKYPNLIEVFLLFRGTFSSAHPTKPIFISNHKATTITD